MRLVHLRDRARLDAYFRRDPWLHLYELGDLDDFFWPHTEWPTLVDPFDGSIRAAALLYRPGVLPVLLALESGPLGPLRKLLRAIEDELPARVYAHLGAGLVDELRGGWTAEPHGAHLKMGLVAPRLDAALAGVAVERLGPGDLDPLLELYAGAYPGNWFDPRMLETGRYFGVRDRLGLASVAGVHVYSPGRRVAALGNITTRPDARGRGLASAVTASLCRTLLDEGIQVGLNVKADNAAAIGCYRRLGFEVAGQYGEWMLSR